MLDDIAVAEKRLENAPHRPSVGIKRGERAKAELIALIREKDMVSAIQGLRPGADHATFCPSLRRLLDAALTLPEARRADVLRTTLLPGGR